ncbi:hypothetical protein JCM10450v2_000988 [Rhodotorula kratochvilovae]
MSYHDRRNSYASSAHSDSERDEAEEYRSLPHFAGRRPSLSFLSRGTRDDADAAEPHRTGMFSRRAREASRSSRSRAHSLSALDSPLSPHPGGQDILNPAFDAPEAFAHVPSLPPSPTDDSTAAIDHQLFAPTFTPRQLARLGRAAQTAQAHDARREKKERGRGNTRAEMKIAMGVLELVETQRKEVKRGGGAGGRSASRGRSGTAGSLGGLEDVVSEVRTKGVLGAFEAVEEQVRHRASEAGEPAHPAASVPAEPIHHTTSDFTPEERKHMAEAGGAAAVLGLFSAGMAIYEHEKEVKRKRSGSQPASRPPTAGLGRPPSVPHPGIAPPVPRPISRPASTGPAPETPYFSSLTRTQHHLVQHAAAALLLKDKKRGTLHDEFEKALGGIEHLVERIEEGMRIGQAGKGGRPKKLFGTPLPDLTKHEGVDSFHGANPHGTVRIPEFLDHCITALMQMDVTTEGILRKSGNLRILGEITRALDHSGGNDTVIDLAALDPVTLADLVKRFLAALPHPVLTGHLFDLFIACSHIKNVGLRRRAMHLVICLMPRVNRDVFEVIGVFLNWLSQFAHITIKDGNLMDLTNIATVMAPTLLHPAHRDPKPAEYPSMIAAVLSLLEEQHVLHAVPYELAQVLHLEVPHEQVHREGGSAGLVQHLARLL